MIKKLLSITLFALASLTSLARPHGEAFAILIEKANITGQCFQFYDQWSTQDVEDIWNQGRNAKSVNYTRAGKQHQQQVHQKHQSEYGKR